MTHEFFNQLVQALRSGEYTQCLKTIENLKGDNCVIGVVSRLHSPDRLALYSIAEKVIRDENRENELITIHDSIPKPDNFTTIIAALESEPEYWINE